MNPSLRNIVSRGRDARAVQVARLDHPVSAITVAPPLRCHTLGEMCERCPPMRLPPGATTSLDPFALSVDVRRDLPEARTVPAIGASG